MLCLERALQIEIENVYNSNSPPSGSPPSPLNGFMEWIHVLNLGWEVDLDVLFDVVSIVIVM